MNRRNFLIACAIGLTLIACSDSDSDKPSAQSEKVAPATQAPVQQGQRQLSASQQAALAAAKDLPKQGKVLEMMHAAGYTYMNVDAGTGQTMWIAASMMRIKPEQNVKWTDAAVMNNFTSKSLHRTFKQILFVSNAQVIE